MYKYTETKKVLIFEHVYAVPSLAIYFDQIAEETKEDFELFFAVSAVEAESRIPFMDIVVIDEERDDCDLITSALVHDIPTIATNTFFPREKYSTQHDRFRLVAKPEYQGLKETVKRFLELIASEKNRLARLN